MAKKEKISEIGGFFSKNSGNKLIFYSLNCEFVFPKL